MTHELELLFRNKLSAVHVLIEDESAQHTGHAGAKSGGGHFRVVIVSQVFEGKSLLQRHRLVNDAVFPELTGKVHALAIKAFTPAEWSSRK